MSYELPPAAMPALPEGQGDLLNRRAQHLLGRIPGRRPPVDACESPTAAELAPILKLIHGQYQRYFIAAMICMVHEDPPWIVSGCMFWTRRSTRFVPEILSGLRKGDAAISD